MDASGRIVAILEEMHAKAFNPMAPPPKASAGLPGGLYINWNPGWDGSSAGAAANTNFSSNGMTDAQTGKPARHDEFTDLVYLRNLLGYRAAHPSNHEFDSDIARMVPVVKSDFHSYTYYKCTLYQELRDMARFDPSGGWDSMANSYAEIVYQDHYNSALGVVTGSTGSTYRVDYAMQCAAALTDDGQRTNNPSLVAAGTAIAKHVVNNAIDPSTHLLPLQMSANGSGNDTIVQKQIKVGEEAQTLDCFLAMYDLTHDATYLTEAQAAVTWMYANALYDQEAGGFFFSVDSDGTSFQSAYKESRQAWMLPLLQHLDRLQPGQWTSRVSEMLTVVKDKLWQSPLPGYVYRVAPHFELYQTHEGPGGAIVTESWVTSEAMDIACQALEGASA